MSFESLGIPVVAHEKSATYIETASVAEKFRARILDADNKKILVTNFLETEQSKDLTVPPNCQGLGRIRHFYRQTESGWPLNPLPIDPANRALNLPESDHVLAQVFQNAACAWRCWYCFVPYNLLSANTRYSKWVTAEEILDLYLSEAHRPPMIDLTGGSPDLTPEWVVWTMEAIKSKGLEGKIFLWSDDNLSTDYLWTKLNANQIEMIQRFRGYGRVACFKGFDAKSFRFNTRAHEGDYTKQFERFGRLIDLGIDLYAYATFTGPSSSQVKKAIPEFIDSLQRIHINIPLRTIPLRIVDYTPLHSRMDSERKASLKIQEDAIRVWNTELERRFCDSELKRNITEIKLTR